MQLLSEKHLEAINPVQLLLSPASKGAWHGPRKALERWRSSKARGANSNGTGLRVTGPVKHTEDGQQEEISLRKIKWGTGSRRLWADLAFSPLHSHHPPGGVNMSLAKDQSYRSKEKPQPHDTNYIPENKFHQHANTLWAEKEAEFIKYIICILYIGKLRRIKNFFGFIVKIHFILFWLRRQAFRWKAVHNTTVFRNEKPETTLTPSVHKKNIA